MFLMTDILPITIWHNSDIRPNNLAMVLDASWALYPGFTLSGILGFDDLNASIFGIGDSGVPTIPAGILQLEYSLSGNKVYGDFLLEAGYTHFLWGNFGYDGEPGDGVPWGGVYMARAIYRYSPNNNGVLLPLTSPYGPGAVWGRLVSLLRFSAVPSFTVSADMLLLSKARDANLVMAYERNDDLEWGNRIWFFALDLPCSYIWHALEFKFIPSLIIGNGKAAFECTLGLHYNVKGKTYLPKH
jgi:hypothetical protein